MESGLTSKQPEKQYEIHSKGDILEFVETLEEETEETEGILNLTCPSPKTPIIVYIFITTFLFFPQNI